MLGVMSEERWRCLTSTRSRLKAGADAQVVRAFRGEGGMRQFREWVMNPDEEELREAAQPKPKRGRKQGSDAPSDDAAPEGIALQGLPMLVPSAGACYTEVKMGYAVPLVPG